MIVSGCFWCCLYDYMFSFFDIYVGVLCVQQVSSLDPNWRLMFSDEFNGTKLDTTKWTVRLFMLFIVIVIVIVIIVIVIVFIVGMLLFGSCCMCCAG